MPEISRHCKHSLGVVTSCRPKFLERPLRRRAFLVITIVMLQDTGALAQTDLDTTSFDTKVLDEGFCASRPDSSKSDRAGGLDTQSMSCAKLMEFLYVSRMKTSEHLEKNHQEQLRSIQSGEANEWKTTLRRISRASSIVSAHIHIIAAISSQRSECFSEHVRLLLIVNLRRLKGLSTSHIKQLWMVAQNETKQDEEASFMAANWLKEAAELLEADLKTMRTVLRAWRPPAPDEARFYSHEADGRFSTMEALRRDTFNEWQMDKGLLRGLVRHVLPLDATVADFGAGSGHYASWLNDTGLVVAHAFDGSPDIELVTKGKVLSADLSKPLELNQKFDWTICIEVAEHIPIDFAPTFLRNLDAHSTQGLVLSWARPGLPGLGSANPRGEVEVIALLRQHTGLHFDDDLTNKLRQASTVAYLSESLFVLVREQRSLGAPDAQCHADGTCPSKVGTSAADLAPGCDAEDGWIYAGNDVQMFSNVASAPDCCDLCSSNANCRFWTWSREESHKDLCWIKSTREYRINHGGFVSGTRIGGSATAAA